MKSILKVENLCQSYDGKSLCLNNVSFDLSPGECLVVLGSSGCGKSSLLKSIAGFLPITGGEIYLRDQLVSSQSFLEQPRLRKIGFLFQEASLFPHLSVRQNIEFGLREQKVKTNEMCDELIDQLGLRELLSRYPHEISGGQKQRVALVRSLVLQPDLILMDEPFSSLDESFVDSFLPELKQILVKFNTACIYVTHRLADLMPLADQVIVFKKGQVLQKGTFSEIYSSPSSVSVAKFLGKGLPLKCTKEGTSWNCVLGEVQVTGHRDSSESTIFVRPVDVKLVEEGNKKFRVATSHFDGESTHLSVETGEGYLSLVCSGIQRSQVGDLVAIELVRPEPFVALSSEL